MQTERLFEIVYTLLDRGRVTAQELADKLQVSKRTILRDIETLTLAKVPVYTTQGKGGGVSLLDGYVLDKAVLSDEEKEQILLGIKTLLPTGGASGKTLSKLGSLFSVKNTDWIEVDFSRWSNPTHDREKFNNLKNAVMQRKALAFSYPNSVGEISERKAYPLSYLQNQSNDRCRGAARNIRCRTLCAAARHAAKHPSAWQNTYSGRFRINRRLPYLR